MKIFTTLHAQGRLSTLQKEMAPSKKWNQPVIILKKDTLKCCNGHHEAQNLIPLDLFGTMSKRKIKIQNFRRGRTEFWKILNYAKRW